MSSLYNPCVYIPIIEPSLSAVYAEMPEANTVIDERMLIAKMETEFENYENELSSKVGAFILSHALRPHVLFCFIDDIECISKLMSNKLLATVRDLLFLLSHR